MNVNNQKMIKATTDPKYRELMIVAAKLEKTPEYKASVKKEKEKRRKKMVKKLSGFFGKPPSGGKRKTKRKKRSRRKKTKKSRRRRKKKLRGVEEDKYIINYLLIIYVWRTKVW